MVGQSACKKIPQLNDPAKQLWYPIYFLAVGCPATSAAYQWAYAIYRTSYQACQELLGKQTLVKARKGMQFCSFQILSCTLIANCYGFYLSTSLGEMLISQSFENYDNCTWATNRRASEHSFVVRLNKASEGIFLSLRELKCSPVSAYQSKWKELSSDNHSLDHMQWNKEFDTGLDSNASKVFSFNRLWHHIPKAIHTHKSSWSANKASDKNDPKWLYIQQVKECIEPSFSITTPGATYSIWSIRVSSWCGSYPHRQRLKFQVQKCHIAHPCT